MNDNEIRKLRPYVQEWISASVGGIYSNGSSTPADSFTESDALSLFYTKSAVDSKFSYHESLENIHHNRLHAVTSTDDHSVTGSQYDLLGLTGVDTLGILSPGSDISGGNVLLISDTDGGFDAADIRSSGFQWNESRGSLHLNDGIANEGGNVSTLRLAVASPADTTLHLKGASGQTGRYLLIEDDSGTDLIRVDAGGNMQSGNFDDSVGWYIGAKGDAWFRDGDFRGTLTASLFTADEINAVQGTVWVTKGQAQLDQEVSIGAVGSSITLRLRDPLSGAFPIAQEDDILVFDTMGVQPVSGNALYSHSWDINSTGTGRIVVDAHGWFTVDSVSRVNGLYEYVCTVEPVTRRVTLREGTVIVNVGHYTAEVGETEATKPGHLQITAAENRFGPAIHINLLDNNEPWDKGFQKAVVLGHLSGIQTSFYRTSWSNSQVFGIAISEDFKDETARHIIASPDHIGINRVNIDLYTLRGQDTYHTGHIDANGSFVFGYDVDREQDGFGSISFDSWTSDFLIGNRDTNYFLYDFSRGEVTIVGGPIDTSGDDPNTDRAALILSASNFGHWDGEGWRSRFLQNGSMDLIATPSDPDLEEERHPNAGLKWNAESGIFYGTDGSATQFSMNAFTGKFRAGGQAVTLDEDGINIAPVISFDFDIKNALTFNDDIRIWGYQPSATTNAPYLILDADTSTANQAFVQIRAMTQSQTNSAQITLESSKSGAEGRATITADQIVLSGIPTSAGATVTGGVYSDGGTLKIK